MHSEIEEFLRELNIISRFAVIENAELTEKYIHKYSNFIKYKYANISKSPQLLGVWSLAEARELP